MLASAVKKTHGQIEPTPTKFTVSTKFRVVEWSHETVICSVRLNSSLLIADRQVVSRDKMAATSVHFPDEVEDRVGL